jgi:transcriptional regulator with XRE-family HTH domain
MNIRIRTIIADNIRHLRNRKRLSQEALADRAGVHRNYIGNIERCEKSVSVDLLADIADALKVQPNALLVENFYKTLEK